MVIVGRQDLTTPLQRAEEMAADIANARLVVIEDCGHMSPLERPAEVSAALRRWLSAMNTIYAREDYLGPDDYSTSCGSPD